MLEFGIFDHLDSRGTPLGPFFEERLELIARAERAGFAGYHLAEHHSTPLGTAGSPAVFLAAAIARTRTIRLGALVHVMPLYHPLRLHEEICMLDHLSGGRIMLGVGRGGALEEHRRFGVDPQDASPLNHEAFAVLMKAFETDVLDFDGKHFSFKDYVVHLKPAQLPHPPLWYGAPSAEAIVWAVPKAINVVSLGPAARAAEIAARYRQEWKALGRAERDLPRIGITRHVVVAETDDAAKTIARRAYARWIDAMTFIWRRANIDFPLAGIYPQDWDALEHVGHGIAGSPDVVAGFLESLERETGINYVLCQATFGDMTFAEASTSLDLFGREIVPRFR
ncbi:MAG: LLM class flavin-dependent oxidoreductase [Pseudolabrys sp.]